MHRSVVLLLFLAAFVALSTPVSSEEADAPDRFEEAMAFIQHLDENYQYFELKGIEREWKMSLRSWRREARKLESDAQMLKFFEKVLDCLRDGNARIVECDVEYEKPVYYYCGISLVQGERGKLYVLRNNSGRYDEIKPGSELLKIDGRSAARTLSKASKELWEEGGRFSSPQQATFLLTNWALRSTKKDEEHELDFELKGDRFSVTVKCDIEVPATPYCMPVVTGLSKSPSDEYVMYKKLDSGVAYIYCGRTSSQTDRAVSEAIEKLNCTDAYIIDLTDCHGREQATLAAITPYAGNCVALVGPGTAHFGERYARDLTTDIRATLVGSNTAGCASYIIEYDLPRGLGVVQYSEKQVRGKFEFKGLSPSMKQANEAEPLTRGTTALIERAERKLKR